MGGLLTPRGLSASPLCTPPRYERLEGLLDRCYANMPLRPSPEELRELFKLAGAG